MRVFHVTPYFAPAFGYGGPPVSVLGLCQGLQRAGVEIEVFTTTANGAAELPVPIATRSFYDSVPVRYFPRRRPRRRFRAPDMGPALSAALTGCDVVHIHGLWSAVGWQAARRARAARVPYVLSPRGMLERGALIYRRWAKRLVFEAIERQNLSGAALIHATSVAEARTLGALAPRVPVIVVPNGVRADVVGHGPSGSFRRRWRLSDTRPLVVYLGRIHPIKRLDLLAAAFARVRVRFPEVQLVIAGPGQVEEVRTAQAWFRDVAPAVTWTGELDPNEKWDLLADADALVLCSDSESFGTSVIEALASGVPVVATRTCPWEELETEGCGRWVDQDVGAIAHGLGEILADPPAARRMGDRGRALVRRKYEWDAVARAMADHYRAVAQTTRAQVFTR